MSVFVKKVLATKCIFSKDDIVKKTTIIFLRIGGTSVQYSVTACFLGIVKIC